MSCFYNKIIIIAPHSDDEIFALPLIYSKDIIFNSIDLLLVENDPERIKEASLSTDIHSMKLITMPEKYNFQGLFFHKHVEELIEYFSNLWGDYDLIISPLIEGGHQDHDTVCATLLLSRELSKKYSKLVLYSTYRNYKNCPWIYQCGVSKSIFSNYLYNIKLPKNIVFILLRTILVCYRSQLKTWVLLFPALIFSMLRSNYGKYVLADNLEFKDLIKLIPRKPLYEIYRGLKHKDWLNAFKGKK